MPSKPPYFPLYVRDFASDAKVEAMTTQEVGAYFLLLCKAWHEEPAGSIPNSDSVLARWARLDAVAWAQCRTAVLAAFVLGTDGRLHQKRMRQEFSRLMRARKGMSEGGKKGAGKRWKEGPEIDPCNGVLNGVAISTPIGSPMASGYGSSIGIDSSLGEVKTKTKGRRTHRGGAGGADFAAFWDAFPRHQAKHAAVKAWTKLAPDPELQAVILAALASPLWRSKDPNYVPYAATWLNGRRWEDKPLPAGGGAAPNGSPYKTTTADDMLRIIQGDQP